MPVITPLLYTTGSSYYSMIARLALTEKRIPFETRNIDIHVGLEQFAPNYARLNPNLTIPTLIYGDTRETSSEDILFFVDQLDHNASLQPSNPADLATMRTLLDLHYAIRIENFTFGKLLLTNPLMRALTTKIFQKEMNLCKTNSAQYPELKTAYVDKEKIIAERMIDFQKENLPATFDSGKKSILQFLEKLDAQLKTSPYAAGDHYSLADIVSTCLLARLEFSKEPALYEGKPALKRYYEAAKQRPSFAAADIWCKMRFSKIVQMVSGNIHLLF